MNLSEKIVQNIIKCEIHLSLAGIRSFKEENISLRLAKERKF